MVGSLIQVPIDGEWNIFLLARASFDIRQFLEELRAILAPSVGEVAS